MFNISPLIYNITQADHNILSLLASYIAAPGTVDFLMFARSNEGIYTKEPLRGSPILAIKTRKFQRKK